MKQIVPFTKNISLETNVDEVTSISLDKTVNEINNGEINGVFDLYLEYRESEISVNTENYSASIPFVVNIDDRYKFDDVSIDIDDFYYEINDNEIVLHIDLLVDGLEIDDRVIEDEIKKHEEVNEEITENNEEERNDTFEETEEKIVEVKVPIYESFDPKTESFVTYNVHIVREDDNIESICLKYNINKEDLSNYNDISNIKLGDKIIVPTYKK